MLVDSLKALPWSQRPVEFVVRYEVPLKENLLEHEFDLLVVRSLFELKLVRVPQ